MVPTCHLTPLALVLPHSPSSPGLPTNSLCQMLQMGHRLHNRVCGVLEVHPQLIPAVKPFFYPYNSISHCIPLEVGNKIKNIIGAFGVEDSWVVRQAQGAWLLQRALLGAQGYPVGCRIPPNLLDHACCTAELLQTHFDVIC